MQTPGANQRIACCCDPVDLFVSRPVPVAKDGIFDRALLASGIVDVRLGAMAIGVEGTPKSRGQNWIRRLAAGFEPRS